MKLKTIIIDSTTLQLEQDGKKGDIIDLKELQKVDNSILIKKIREGTDEEYKKFLSEERKKFEVEKKLAIEMNNKALSKEIDELKSNLQSNNRNHSIEIEKTKLNEQNNFLGKIHELEKEIISLRKDISNKELEHKEKLEIFSLNVNNMHQKAIYEKDMRISSLELTKSSLNVKKLGEELENWCNNEFENYKLSGGFTNCVWRKDTISTKDDYDSKGTKADFIFEIFDKDSNNKLMSVCCEMKSESPDSKNKRKNEEYFKKLDIDRKKKNCEYALLVSELEWDSSNDVPVRRIEDYENMYLIRPQYFIIFLSLLKSLAQKYQDLILTKQHENENFKNSQLVIKEFNHFKETYLDKPINALKTKVEQIKVEAEKINDSANKIIKSIDLIISENINNIKFKIERLDIRKIARKIDKLSE